MTTLTDLFAKARDKLLLNPPRTRDASVTAGKLWAAFESEGIVADPATVRAFALGVVEMLAASEHGIDPHQAMNDLLAGVVTLDRALEQTGREVDTLTEPTEPAA